jgi:hypothetical protein
MHLPGFERQPQRLAGPEQMRLADDFVKRARAQPLRQWRSRLVLGEKIVHCEPEGAVNR